MAILFVCIMMAGTAFTSVSPKDKERGKALTKAAELWAAAMQYADDDNEAKLVESCRGIVILLEPTDSLYVLSRNVLAELSYDRQDMEGIYQHYAYFKYLNCKEGFKGQYEELCDRLKTRYDSLVIEDSKKPITEGIYATVTNPLEIASDVIIRIMKNGTSWSSAIVGGQAWQQDSRVKKSEPQYYQTILQSGDASQGEDLSFSVVWNKYSQRNPNESLAKAAINSGNEFGRNMAGELGSGRYNTEQVLTGTAVTALGQGIFTAIASLASRGSSTYRSTELVWSPVEGFSGAIDAKIILTKVSQNTNQSNPVQEKTTGSLKLYKLYPHTKALFIDSKKKSVIFPEHITTQDVKKDAELRWQLAVHPLIFDEDAAALLGIDGKIDLKVLKKNKNFRRLMYRVFVKNAAFPHFDSDPIAARMATYGACYADYSYGQIVYKLREGSGPSAIIDRDGTEIYEEFSDAEAGRNMNYVNAYHPNGYRYVSQWDESKKRTAEIKYSEGGTYSGEVWGFRRDGNGVYNHVDGKIYKGVFNNGYLTDGECIVPIENGTTTLTFRNGEQDSIAKVQFNNGDIYVGPVNVDFLPHGKGKFTAKGKKWRTTTWVAGSMVHQKKNEKRMASRRKKKGSAKR